MLERVQESSQGTDFDEICSIGRVGKWNAGMKVFNWIMSLIILSPAVIIIVLIIIALASFGFGVIAYLCIKGTENVSDWKYRNDFWLNDLIILQRDHVRVKPMMILLAILSILSFLNILSFTAHGVVSGLIYGVFYGYLFVVIHSLFTVFEEEFERGYTGQPGAKV